MIFRNRYRKRMTFEKGKTLPLYFYFVKSLLFNPSPRKGKERVLCRMSLFLLSHFLSCLKNFSSFYPLSFPPSFLVFCIRRLFFIYLISFLNGRQPPSLHDGVVKRDSASSLSLYPRIRRIPAFGFTFPNE